MLPIVFHPRSNWQVAIGKASASDRDIIDRVIELLRGAQPYVRLATSPGG